MTCLFYTTDRIPTWALSYLINDDASSLSSEEKILVDLYRAKRTQEICSLVHSPLHSIIFDPEDNSYFSWENNVNQLGGEVVDCHVSGVYHD